MRPSNADARNELSIRPMSFADRTCFSAQASTVHHGIDPNSGQDRSVVSESCCTNAFSIAVMLGLSGRYAERRLVQSVLVVGVHRGSIFTGLAWPQ